MLGSIIPAPLAIPTMCIPSGSVKLWIFGQQFVVIMACATGKADSVCRVSIALGTTSEERSLAGNLHPITPVLEGNTDVGPMDNRNLEHVLNMAQTEADTLKVSLFRDYDPQGRGEDMPDPWYGEEEGFEEVFQITHRTIIHFLETLRK